MPIKKSNATTLRIPEDLRRRVWALRAQGMKITLTELAVKGIRQEIERIERCLERVKKNKQEDFKNGC